MSRYYFFEILTKQTTKNKEITCSKCNETDKRMIKFMSNEPCENSYLFYFCFDCLRKKIRVKTGEEK